MTTNGLTGFSTTFEKYSSSFFISKPAALISRSIPTMDEWALWAVPKASFTNMSPYEVSFLLKMSVSTELAILLCPSTRPTPSSAL